MSQRTAKIFFQVILLLTLALPAHAAEVFEFYTGARQLGMGGAYTGVVNDETALLTNPAGLGKIRDKTVTIADPEIHGSMENFRVAKLENATKVFTIQGLLDSLNQEKGTHYHSKLQVFPSFVGTNFGLGLHVKYLYDAEVDAAGTTYRLDYVNDYAAALGFCFRFFSGIVKLGFSARAVNRVEIHKDLDATSTGLEVQNTASEGLGIGADVGLIITVPVAGLPTLSAVVRDVGTTSYDLTDGVLYATETRPVPTPQTVDAGISFFPIYSNHSRGTFTVEYHGVMTASEETDHMRRVHVGYESNYADFFFFRLGMNQRYWTTGLELASERVQIQLTSYGEEIGTTEAPRQDRRWVTKFAYRF